MKFFKKSIGILFIVALFGGGYYLWQKRYDYFFQGKMEIKNDENFLNTEKNNSLDSQKNYFEEEDDAKTKEPYQEIDDNSVSQAIKTESYKEILATDCDDNCSSKEGTGDYQYCLELCGLRNSRTDLPDDCEELSGLEKDSCFKAKAVEKKDYKYCDMIEDTNLKESCRNRVLEEVL